MKNLILENYQSIDIPEELQRRLKVDFLEDRYLWTSFYEAFWPENRAATRSKFDELEDGGNIVAHHTVVDYQQIELMTVLLRSMYNNGKGKKFNVYIMNPSLIDILNKYLDKYESDITPGTKEYDDNPDLRAAYKELMNEYLIEMVEKTNLYRLGRGQNYDFLVCYDKKKKQFYERRV